MTKEKYEQYVCDACDDTALVEKGAKDADALEGWIVAGLADLNDQLAGRGSYHTSRHICPECSRESGWATLSTSED